MNALGAEQKILSWEKRYKQLEWQCVFQSPLSLLLSIASSDRQPPTIRYKLLADRCALLEAPLGAEVEAGLRKQLQGTLVRHKALHPHNNCGRIRLRF